MKYERQADYNGQGKKTKTKQIDIKIYSRFYENVTNENLSIYTKTVHRHISVL